jgi:hypothetical protein
MKAKLPYSLYNRLLLLKESMSFNLNSVTTLLENISPREVVKPMKLKKKLSIKKVAPTDPTGLAWKQALLYIKSLPAAHYHNSLKEGLRLIWNDKRQHGRSIRVTGWHPSRYHAVKKALKTKHNIDAEVTVSRPGNKYQPARCRLFIPG